MNLDSPNGEIVPEPDAGGPFVRNGIDMYTRSSALYWFIWVWVTLYALLLVVVYFGVFINNASPLHTYTGIPGDPGTLTSQRYTPPYNLLRVTVFSNLFFVFCMIGLVMARAMRGASIALVVVMGIALILQVIAVAGLGAEYSTCNQNDQLGNICNDARYCCAYPAIAYCAAQICTTPLLPSQLVPDGDFLGLFWMNFVFLLAFQVVFMLLVIIYWFSTPEELAPGGEAQYDRPHREPPQPMSLAAAPLRQFKPRKGAGAPSLKKRAPTQATY